MIAVDTNVLLRHLLQDDPEQSPAASRFFALRTPDDPAFVSTAALLELIWTLRSRYGYPQAAVSSVVWSLLRSRDVQVQDSAGVRRAVWDAADESADLADAIIAHAAIDAGCDSTVTFDRRAQRLPGMLPVG
jgi:predicted nucleic-acid-binding protein